MQNRIELLVGLFVLAALAVLAYMGFQVGALRFDRLRYYTYHAAFNDVSGLSKKAQVKIAGVTVGWVEELELLTDQKPAARVTLMVHRDYSLTQDSCAIVRQDGFLGPKYVEIMPGDSSKPRLRSGCALGQPSVEPVSIDELLHKVERISDHVCEVTGSLKNSFGGHDNEQLMKDLLCNLSKAAERIASISECLDRSVSRHSEDIDNILQIGTHFSRLSDQLESCLFPSFQESVEKVAHVFDRDVTRIASKLDSSIEALEEASVQVRDGFRTVGSVAEKIDEGKGLIGKLVNDDETYRDLKVAVQGLKQCFARIDMLQLVFDTHFESMYRPAEYYAFEDSKGYFDIRIHPNEDHFYLIQLAISEKGVMSRKETKYEFADGDHLVDLKKMDLPDWARLNWQYHQEREKFTRNTMRVGLQIGKILGPIALRFGIFDGYSAGLGADVEIPFPTDKFRWIMTFEGYDYRGWNRERDRSPHLKWLNRIYFLRNLYMTFGADDFVSQRNANIFFGAGLRFGDDDIKYFLPSIGGLFSFN